jgi:hypothetical protein
MVWYWDVNAVQYKYNIPNRKECNLKINVLLIGVHLVTRLNYCFVCCYCIGTTVSRGGHNSSNISCLEGIRSVEYDGSRGCVANEVIKKVLSDTDFDLDVNYSDSGSVFSGDNIILTEV